MFTKRHATTVIYRLTVLTLPIHTGTPDKTRRSCLCRVCCELDDCSERVQTSNFLSVGDSLELSCESSSHRRSGRDRQDSLVVSGVNQLFHHDLRLARQTQRNRHEASIYSASIASRGKNGRYRRTGRSVLNKSSTDTVTGNVHACSALTATTLHAADVNHCNDLICLLHGVQ